MAEVLKELRGIRGEKPVTADELKASQNGLTLTLPGQWETMNAVLGSINEIVTYGLPDNYYETYASKVDALTPAEMTPAAKVVIAPDRLIWVVVGDRTKIEAGIRELNLGEIHLIDADGNPVTQPPTP